MHDDFEHVALNMDNMVKFFHNNELNSLSKIVIKGSKGDHITDIAVTTTSAPELVKTLF